MALDKPPSLLEKFYIVQYPDGTSALFKFCSKKALCHFLRDSNVTVTKISYADLVNAITQRVYDYQFYFEQFIQTNAANTVAYNAALAQLADVFSNDLTLYQINKPDGTPIFPPATTKAGVVAFQQLIHPVFQGFTLHTAPNVRVRPICSSTTAQASSGAAEVDYSLINKGAGPLNYLDTGYYNFNWKLEADGVWRIVTYTIINKIDTLIPPATTTPVPFVPYPNNPPSGCPNC